MNWVAKNFGKTLCIIGALLSLLVAVGSDDGTAGMVAAAFFIIIAVALHAISVKAKAAEPKE